MNLTNLHVSILEVFQHLQTKHPELQTGFQKLSSSSTAPDKFPEIIKPLIKRYCKGKGLEIGAGKPLYCDPENTLFLDKNTDNKDQTPDPDIISYSARKISIVGGYIRDVQVLAGHSSLQTTQRHIESDSEAKRRGIDLSLKCCYILM